MNKKELLAYLLENNTSTPPLQVAIGMAVALILAMFIYVVYKKTYTGVLYSKGFNVTLVMITIITAMVLMIIGSSLALSLGMVGALSIVRFRTAVKEPKDIAFLFWAIGAGISCGTGIFLIGIIGSVVIAAVLFLLGRGIYESDTYLIILDGESGVDLPAAEALLASGARRFKLKMQNLTAESVSVTYEVSLRGASRTELVQKLRALERVSSVNLVSYTGEIAG